MILLLVAILLTCGFSGASVKGKNNFNRQFRCVFLSTLRSISRTYIETQRISQIGIVDWHITLQSTMQMKATAHKNQFLIFILSVL